jgi:hypothetical protein
MTDRKEIEAAKASELKKLVSGTPDYVLGRIFRPGRDPVKLIKEHDSIKAVTAQTRGDIDDGASAYVVVDRNFKPTGEPAADPPGACCLICKKRMWAYDNDTAFLIQVSFYDDSDWKDIRGSACCEECSKLDDKEIMRKVRGA